MAYDVFLSHNHADKEWARELCAWLQHTDYNGRSLRVWLDEQILDRDRPLTDDLTHDLDTALDQSRTLAFVLSPESAASAWVRHEIDHFLATRRPGDVVVLRRRACELPAALADAPLVEWPDGDGEPSAPREQLLTRVCPSAWDPTFGEWEYAKQIRRTIGNATYARPANVYDASPDPAFDALADELLAHDIDDLDGEGPAIRAFVAAGELLTHLDDAGSYHLRMALGECLAIGQLRSSRYGRVAARLVDDDLAAHRDGPSFATRRHRALNGRSGPAPTTYRLFTVARAASKLAEIDPARIDLSTAWAVLRALDERATFDAQETLVAMMTARAIGKVRGTAVGELLIRALVASGGHPSHVAAAGAISTRFEQRDLDYCTHELQARAARAGAREPVPPPSASTVALLRDPSSPLRRDPDRDRLIDNAVSDLERFFPDAARGHDGFAEAIRPAPPMVALVNGPLVGRVRTVTRANMEMLAAALGPTDIACFADWPIVDALFENVGGYIVADDARSDALRTRIERRHGRFATIDPSDLALLHDSDTIALWPSDDGGVAGLALGDST